MKQVLQNLQNGETLLEEVPCPKPGPGEVLIRTRSSLVSFGTEKMLVDFGRANVIDKARQQPEKVRMVLDKVKTDGVLATYDAVQRKLKEPLALGYCNVGTVVEVGEGVHEFAPGDRVVSNGKHAEFIAVGKNLCAAVPPGVDDEQAAFTVLGAIALQGIRLINPTLGETIVVSGLGLIGLLAIQLLKANGCRVLGLDVNADRVELARRFGVEACVVGNGNDPVQLAMAFSRQLGVDGVLITASTASSEPVSQAAHMCRKRGRIVLVGVTGLELNRADFYEKELSFQVSCSYGPGRYDPVYEEQGQDYPIGFVRWTEQRNFIAVMDMLASGGLQVAPLITHRFSISDALAAYEVLATGQGLGILLQYADDVAALRTVVLPGSNTRPDIARARARLAFIGTGNYASAVLIPAFAKTGASLIGTVSQKGVSAVTVARRHRIHSASTDVEAVLGDDTNNVLVISTRHNTHADLVRRGLEAGKHVFVEKPLCLSLDELDRIREAHARAGTCLMVGFNRRFAPMIQRMQSRLPDSRVARHVQILVNAGAIPSSHWTQDPQVGGGRILGEACHFIDLARFLAGAPIVSVHTLAGASAAPVPDNVIITLGFANGSTASVTYLADGHSSLPKEEITLLCAGKVQRLTNYRKLQSWGYAGLGTERHWRLDKGQQSCCQAFVDAIEQGGQAPIAFAEIDEVMRATLQASHQATGDISEVEAF